MSAKPGSVLLQSYPNSGQYEQATIEVQREMPKDHFIWSLCCLLYSNPCCLGLAALIHSVKARDRKVVGDIEGARKYATTARKLNIISSVLAVVIAIIVIIVIAVQISALKRFLGSMQNRNTNRFDGSDRG